MKTRIFSGALVVFMVILLCLGRIALAQGVISLPWTGQEKCYNSSGGEISCAGTRQDGDVQAGVDWPNPRFTVSGDCVTDNLTGLMWSKNANLANKTMPWEKALDYVASINSGSGLCGHHDWHLPNINELESLVNTGEANTAAWLMSQGFSNVQGSYYWSSTTWVHVSDNAWPVHMLDGTSDNYIWGSNVPIHSKENSYYVWPVREDSSVDEAPAQVWKTGQTTKYHEGDDGDLERGVAWPSPRFADHGDGTVTDNLTGLMWSKDADVMGATTWQDALDYVKTWKTGNHSDWRLPNRKELLSLIDRSAFEPPLPDQQIFLNVHVTAFSCFYWTSTTVANHTSNAWIIGMVGGPMTGIFDKTSPASTYLWPVRSAQAPSNNPVISVTPNPVDFGTVSAGATLDKSITVKNAGNADLVIGTITSPSLPFTILSDDCSGKTLSLGQTCTATYGFSPDSEGNFSSSSSIPSNDPARNPLTVTLKGQTGVISLSSPSDGIVFDCCSLSTPPVFSWSPKESFKSYEVQFSSDQSFSSIPTVVKPKGSATEVTPTTSTWKKILMVPGTGGGKVYWQVKGKRADNTTALSKALSLEMEQPEPAGNQALSSTSKSSLPGLSWETNCNKKFKVWFGSDLQFSNKKSFSFSVKNPAETFEASLTSSQWGSVRKLVGDATGATIYWYVESWDGLGRYAETDVRSFVLTD